MASDPSQLPMSSSFPSIFSSMVDSLSTYAQPPISFADNDPTESGGTGSALPKSILIAAGLATVFATVVSTMSVFLHLKNYRKPILQRMVIRIMIMVPLYGISSLISLFSLEAAFFIDVIRDIYEAFVIYCFFNLLLSYLGGERSLLILVHGRAPKSPPIPFNIFKREFDVSDPYTFLFLKRGILQYVQVKPLLAVATLILKVVGKYNEGDFRVDSGYLYVSIIYNTSICLSLYCLAMFWLCISEDLKPFRPMPKFLCVKGILFFSFWQSIVVSLLVSAGAIRRLGPYTDNEHISLGLTDTLICLEMPLFALAHMYAFSHTDYIDSKKRVSYVGRMPVWYALRDAFGIKDVVEDSKATLRGEGMDYREFEPSEGFMHQGEGRERRIKAGLRYSKGGRGKYWLPLPNGGTGLGEGTRAAPTRWQRGINNVVKRVAGDDQAEEVHAPLLDPDIEDVLHVAEDLRPARRGADPAEGLELEFEDVGEDEEGEDEERLYEEAKQYLFGDYCYPCIDASSEEARRRMWDEEERILRDERSAWFHGRPGSIPPPRGQASRSRGTYGAVGTSSRSELPTRERGDYRVVDMGAENLPSPQTDLKLKWTRSPQLQSQSRLYASSTPASPQRALRPPPTTRTQSFTQLNRSSPAPSPRHSPRPISKSNSASSSTSGSLDSRGLAKARVTPPGQSPRPDAVDLVVEDDEAAEEDMMNERRRGEPAVRGSGLRKVYRRRYLAASGDEVEEDVEGEEYDHDHSPGVQREWGRESKQELKEEDERRGPKDEGEVERLEEDATVARASLPPPHARLDVGGHGAGGALDRWDEENPWA